MANGEKGDDFLQRKLEFAVKARDLEVTLQWSRGTYFGALLLAAGTGYWLSAANSLYGGQIASLSLAMFFSACWVMVAMAGRYWQSLWEARVALLEQYAMGDLYGVAEGNGNWWPLSAGFRLSPSRLSLVVSASTFACTVLALLATLIVGPTASADAVKVLVYFFAIAACAAIPGALWCVWPRRNGGTQKPTLISKDNLKRYLAGPIAPPGPAAPSVPEDSPA